MGKLTGPYAWILKTSINYIIKPFINLLIRKKYLTIDLSTGLIKAGAITEARKNGTQAEYDAAVDDIFN